MDQRSLLTKVGIFTVVMLLVTAGLVVVFGEFRFAATNVYHAKFTNASRLRSGQDVRVAGIPVGTVKDVKLMSDNSVDVTFDLNKRYQLYTNSEALIRYENLVGDRYMEITTAASTDEPRKLAPGSTLTRTEPALDLDALLGGMKPVLNGLDGHKINEITGAVIELMQGQGGALNTILASTGSFTHTLASHDQLIGDVVNNLNTVLATVDDKSEAFDKSVDRLQKLISGLAEGKDSIAGAVGPLAQVETDLTDVLKKTRRPIQGVIENARPLATVLDRRKDELNEVIDPLEENYLRLNALGAYGSFFNVFYCTVSLKVNGPAGSDIIIPMGGQNVKSKGRCSPVQE